MIPHLSEKGYKSPIPKLWNWCSACGLCDRDQAKHKHLARWGKTDFIFYQKL